MQSPNPPLAYEIDEYAKYLLYALRFSGKQSQFQMLPDYFMDKSDINAVAARAGYGGYKKYFTDLVKNELFEEKVINGKSFTLVYDLEKTTWILTDESKEIKGYKCFKAAGIRLVSDRDWNTREVPIYAWYSPDIPYQFGPFEAVGLPGLVLQLDLTTYSVVVQNMDLGKTVELDKPEEKVMSREEYMDILKGKVEEKFGQ